ncbi:MAG: c-type cytochrome [Acidobacteria bacterium]|nr:c-type cytochrome [Acidobacteriota bacterium]
MSAILFFFMLQSDLGATTYDKYCAQCHGEQGDGQGIATEFVMPRPRNFTTGVFKFRSTQSGQLPLESDLEKVVREGIRGTSMPSFAQLGESEIKAVVAHIQGYYQAVIDRDKEEGFYPPKVAEMGNPPKVTDALITHGREVYLQSGCGDCHGYEGRADGPSSLTLKDDYDESILPANLNRGWEFRAGHELTDIFRAFTTGLSGTPMASFADAIPADDRWALASYVQSLSVGEEPTASAQVSASIVDQLPESMDDPLWDSAPEAYFPLTGQMMWAPVNHQPGVRSVTVKALHDQSSVALLVSWDDPSFSVAGAEAPGGADEEDDWGFETEEEDDFGDFFDEEPAAQVDADQFAIQFPSGFPAPNERPYIVMGDGSNPVNLWRWVQDGSLASQQAPAEAQSGHANLWTEYKGNVSLSSELAKGRNQISALSDGTPLKGSVHYLNGRYHLMVTRTLLTDSEDEVQLEVGKFLPILFWAWDGHRNEKEAMGNLSAWFFLRLEQPVDRSVYVKTAGAAFLTAILLLWAIRAARDSSRQEPSEVVESAT